MNRLQILVQEESPEAEGQGHGCVDVVTRRLQIKEKNWDWENPETHNTAIVLRPIAVGTSSVKSRVGNDTEDPWRTRQATHRGRSGEGGWGRVVC